MNVARKLEDTTTRHIPHGYASVKVDPSSVPGGCVYKGDFIPHMLLKDLYDKINAAVKELKLAGTVKPVFVATCITQATSIKQTYNHVII